MNVSITCETKVNPTDHELYLEDLQITIPPLGPNNYRSPYELIAVTNLALSALGDARMSIIDANIRELDDKYECSLKIMLGGTVNLIHVDWLGNDLKPGSEIWAQFDMSKYVVTGPEGPKGDTGPQGPKGWRGSIGHPSFHKR